MSIHDEQEIQRLHEQTDKLHWALKASEQKLKEAMRLLSEACCAKDDMLNGQIWRQRKANLEERYRNHED
jgi:hypothetical protein